MALLSAREYFVESHVDDSHFFLDESEGILRRTFKRSFVWDTCLTDRHFSPSFGWCLELVVNALELELLPLIDK
jgi:hypothetical protein